MKSKKSGGLAKGPLSKVDMRNIEDWHSSMDIIDIASRLNRSPKQVEKYLREYLAHAPKIVAKRSATEEIKRELKSSAFWSSTKEQFTERELIFYENSYIDYRLQIVDVTTVEIKQIHQLIDLDIRTFRLNKDSKQIREEIERLEFILEKEHKRDVNTMNQDEVKFMEKCENQLIEYKKLSKEKTSEHKDLLSKHGDILKILKATRDQRIKSLEGRGKFMELLNQLEIESFRTSVSHHTALAEMAKQKELERLAYPHKYNDHTVDQPILNHSTNNKEFE